jgi:hypothetical protein
MFAIADNRLDLIIHEKGTAILTHLLLVPTNVDDPPTAGALGSKDSMAHIMSCRQAVTLAPTMRSSLIIVHIGRVDIWSMSLACLLIALVCKLNKSRISLSASNVISSGAVLLIAHASKEIVY